jgi:hypothetical protein
VARDAADPNLCLWGACRNTWATNAAHTLTLADIVRDLFGNPFRTVPIHPDWLSWQSGAVKHIATAICEEGTFDRLSVLGDALEDAGCTSADRLDHCRGLDGHVRGCWLIDRILAKDR